MPIWRTRDRPVITKQFRDWLVVGLFIAIIHAPLLTKPFVDSDEAVYASIAALSNEVGHLYGSGGVDNKFPGIFWIYAGVFRLFGQYSMNAVHAVTIAVVLATAGVLGAIAARIGYRSAASIVALFYGVATTLYTPKMLGANTEVFAMLPVSIAVLLVLPRSGGPLPGSLAMYVAGLLIGAGTVIRQLAGPNLLLVCGVPVFWTTVCWRRRLGASFVAALGCLTALGWLAYFFHTQGTLRDFWYWTVEVVSVRYLPDGWHFQVPLHQLAMFAETIVFWVLIGQRARKWRLASVAERALWGWLLLSLGIVLLPGRFHPHYMIQLFAPLAVLAGIEFRQRIDAARETGRWGFVRWCSGLLAALALVFAVIAVLWEPFAPAYFSKLPPRYIAVADHIRATTTPTDRIFVWGAYTPIYVIADRLPATRFVAFKRGCGRHEQSPFEDCWDSGPEMWPLLARDLAATTPAVIVDTSPANLGDFKHYPIQQFSLLRDLLATRYSKERTINGVDVYRRLPN